MLGHIRATAGCPHSRGGAPAAPRRGPALIYSGLHMGSAKRIAAAAAVFISCAALLAFVFDEDDSNKTTRPDELLSPLEVGLYAVRAERESADYDKKAERQIAFATDNDNAASAESQLAAKEEKRARQSAFLAADVKSRIDRVLEEGKDEVYR